MNDKGDAVIGSTSHPFFILYDFSCTNDMQRSPCMNAMNAHAIKNCPSLFISNLFFSLSFIFFFQIISLTTTLTYAQSESAVNLGSICNHDMDCTDVIKDSLCSMEGYCECKPFYAQYNETKCVQGECCVVLCFSI